MPSVEDMGARAGSFTPRASESEYKVGASCLRILPRGNAYIYARVCGTQPTPALGTPLFSFKWVVGGAVRHFLFLASTFVRRGGMCLTLSCIELGLMLSSHYALHELIKALRTMN